MTENGRTGGAVDMALDSASSNPRPGDGTGQSSNRTGPSCSGRKRAEARGTSHAVPCHTTWPGTVLLWSTDATPNCIKSCG